jgi:hypothetical protein
MQVESLRVTRWQFFPYQYVSLRKEIGMKLGTERSNLPRPQSPANGIPIDPNLLPHFVCAHGLTEIFARSSSSPYLDRKPQVIHPPDLQSFRSRVFQTRWHRRLFILLPTRQCITSSQLPKSLCIHYTPCFASHTFSSLSPRGAARRQVSHLFADIFYSSMMAISRYTIEQLLQLRPPQFPKNLSLPSRRDPEIGE